MFCSEWASVGGSRVPGNPTLGTNFLDPGGLLGTNYIKFDKKRENKWQTR